METFEFFKACVSLDQADELFDSLGITGSLDFPRIVDGLKERFAMAETATGSPEAEWFNVRLRASKVDPLTGCLGSVDQFASGGSSRWL